MKVIFLKDVPKAGKRYDIKEVNDGYAANFLFPKKLAEPATAKRIAEVETKLQHIRVEKEIRSELLTKHLAALRDVALVMRRKANESGHLFSSIKPEDIVEALAAQKIELAEDAIKLSRPIKETGTHAIAVEINGKKSEFKVTVVGTE
jgi:large subunit ribosomal protein L9